MELPVDARDGVQGDADAMTDPNALPDGHVLKPLEDRMLAMCDDMHPAMRVLGGNFVAALRVYAAQHPTLHEDMND